MISIVYKNPLDIKPYTKNARINDATVDKLCEIIPKVGFNQPILVDKKGVIVKGHARWQAAIKLGMEQVPVIVSENDEETNKLDRIADNKIAEFSSWDDEMLKAELFGLNTDFDLNLIGIDTDLFSDGIKDEIDNWIKPPTMYTEIQAEVEAEKRGEPIPESKPFITERDVQKTVPIQKKEYTEVICPKCGERFLV